MTTQKPFFTLRDGALKATVWRNEGPKGPFYSLELSRTYKDEHDQYQDSRSFSGGELLRVAHLCTEAHARILDWKNSPTEESS